MAIIETIKFDNDYPKMYSQRAGRLLAVFNDLSGQLLLRKFPDLVSYDTLRDDGRYYAIKPEESYMLLMFEGDRGILFTTFRKQNAENADKYNSRIGCVFKFEVEGRKGGFYGN